jgi:formylglycine-generating enzyme required for sulfatase activity
MFGHVFRRATAVATVLLTAFLAVTFGSAAGRTGAQELGFDRRLKRDAEPPVSETRVALVIGNGAYAKGRLKNPPNDARAMAGALREAGFAVQEAIDADKVRMQRAIRDFGKRLKESGGVGLFYYAGHGVQVGGRNFLIPLGAETEVEGEADVDIFCIDAENVLRQMEEAGARINIVILDACRDNPFSRSFRRDAVGGLAEITAPSGTFIAYATDPGKTASDGEGENGLYTQELLARMRQPGLRIEDVFNLAGAEVERKSGKRQQPWISSKLRGSFYFKPPTEAAKSDRRPVKAADPAAVEQEAWEVIRESGDPEDFKEFLRSFPNGANAPTARLKVRKLEAGNTRTGTNGASRPAAKPGVPKPGTPMEAAGIKFVFIPAGEFQMGSPDGEAGRSSDEGPVHRVVIAQPFWLGQFEVTQAQWEAVMGANPSFFKNCPQCPVEGVSWDDCQEFIRRLNAKNDGNAYALPTEAEWEYACRAGTTGPFSFGATITPDQVNYDGNYPYGKAAKGVYRGKTIPVGSLNRPNAWGLHDMHGNVFEWCQDRYHENYNGAPTDGRAWEQGSDNGRVVRGGSWDDFAGDCRAANRFRFAPDDRDDGVGVRVAVRLATN